MVSRIIGEGDVLGTGNFSSYIPKPYGGAQQTTQKKKKNFWEDQISTGGSLGGALAGGAAGTAILPGVGTLIGALLGGAAGGFGGQVAENKVTGEQDLFKDAGTEALWGGATALPFGAVGKLGKAGFTVAKGLGSDASKLAAKDLVTEAGVKTMSRGAVGKLSLSDALKDAPAKAAAERLAMQPSLLQKMGGKLSGAADDLAIKQFRLTPSQLSSFKTKFGEDAGQTIRKYGFNSAEDVATKGIDPLQKQFGELVQGAGNISTDVLRKNFSDTVAKLAGANSSTNRAIGQQLQTEVEGILAKYGKEIPAGKLNDVRREFDSLVNYTNKAADPNKYGVNKRVADVLRKTLQNAEPSGQLKEVGQEISKLRQLSDNVAKQGELGRGSLPLSITGLLGAGAGGVAGGLPGALSTLALTNAVNSQGGRKVLMGAVDGVTKKLTSQAPKDIGQTLKQATTRIGGIGAAQTAMGGVMSQSPSDLNNMAETTPTITTSNPATMPPNMDPSYNSQAEASSPFGYSSEQIGQALMAAYADGNDKAVKQLEGMYQLAASYEESQMKASTAKPMSAEASKQLANAQTGLQALDTIEQSLQNDPSIQQKSAIPGSILGGLAGQVLGTGEYEAARQQAIDVIGRMRSGGAITSDEESRFRKFLPQPYDDAQTSQYKLGLLRNAFNTLVSSEQGSSTTDLASALKAAGY